MQELAFVRSKVIEIDKELHDLREDFADTHLSKEEQKLLAGALQEEHEGKNISHKELKKRLGL